MLHQLGRCAMALVFLVASSVAVVAAMLQGPPGPPAPRQEPPRKGETVRVSASFAKVESRAVEGYVVTLNVIPCFPLEITGVNAKKPRWDVTAVGIEARFQLEGAWLARMHRTNEDCKAQFSAEGEPQVRRSGQTFILEPARAK